MAFRLSDDNIPGGQGADLVIRLQLYNQNLLIVIG